MIYTYEEIKNALMERISLLNDWKRSLFMGVYDSIFSAIAYVINKKAIYPAEVFYRESFLETATKSSSIIPRLKYLSYTEHRKRGASGTLLITASETFDGNFIYSGDSVIIPKWTKFKDESGNINVYSIEENIYYTGTVGSLEIKVKEGEPKEFLYTAMGEASEKITLHSDAVDNDEFSISLVDENNIVLENISVCGKDIEEENMYFVNDLDSYICEVSNAYDFQSVTFTFGDGITSRKLLGGERILIKYIQTKGDQGNIVNKNIITTISDTLYDSLENEVTLYVTNDEAISDGSDVESLDSMKYNSSSLFGTGYRCGSYADWLKVLENHPLIYKSVIWTTDDVADDTVTTNQNKIFISAISADGDGLTIDQQQTITDYLKKDKKSPTERVSWQPLKIVHAMFDVNAVVKNQSFLIVEEQINKLLRDNYFILNSDFKQNIYDSNFTRIIDNLDNIVRHNTSLKHLEKGDFSYFVSGHQIYPSWTSENTDILEDQVYLLENSLELWVKKDGKNPVLMGYDDNGVIRPNNNTYVMVDLGGNKKISSPTGLENSSRIYTATVEINDFGVQTISVIGSQAQTMSDLVDQIKASITDIDVSFINGDNEIKFSVGLFGDTTIELLDIDLFSSLFGGGVSIGDSVSGYKYTITGGSINYDDNRVSFVISDLSAIDPETFEIGIAYKTKDGDGNQTNDIRLQRFNIITSVDSEYNTFNFRYE